MSRTFRHRAVLSAFLAVAATVACADETIGVASLVRNNVNGVLPTRTFQINVGENVVRDEIVKTSHDSVAKIVFTDSTNLSIGPNSMVKLDKFVAAGPSSYGKATINVVKGAFRFTTGHSDKRAYEIKTGVASLGVRGTIFECLTGLGRASCNVLEGLVHVRTRDGHVCEIGAGRSVEITASACTPGAGVGPNSQIFAGQCLSEPALCETHEFSGLPPHGDITAPQNDFAVFGGNVPFVIGGATAAFGGAAAAAVLTHPQEQLLLLSPAVQASP